MRVWITFSLQSLLSNWMVISFYWKHKKIISTLYFYTPRQQRDGCNSFGTICPSVSVCVCLALTGERPDIRTWISTGRSSGRISRSVKVIGQRSRSPGPKKRFLPLWVPEVLCHPIPRSFLDPSWRLPYPNSRCGNSKAIYLTPYMNGRATTWGVFKAYVVFCYNFFLIKQRTCKHEWILPMFICTCAFCGKLGRASWIYGVLGT